MTTGRKGGSKGGLMVVSANDDTLDQDLWPLVLANDPSAFEILVRRYQSLVCAVAYNACGNLAQSEDVAQETFWAAWRERNSLKESKRLREWLCGIARNQGMNALRRSSRPAEATSSLSLAGDTAVEDSDPAESAVTKEEESLVWQSLSEIPELYREPLILFYREQQSISEVAKALDLNPDVVKQRLTRGRAMLRERVADLVEGTLRRSRPGRPLTIAIMAGLTAVSAGSKTAFGATAAGVGVGTIGVQAAVAAGVIKGIASGLFGSSVGLLLPWLVTRIQAHLAPTKREREIISQAGNRQLIASAILLVAILVVTLTGTAALMLGVIENVRGMIWTAIAIVASVVSFLIYLAIDVILMHWRIRQIRSEVHELNDSPLRVGLVSSWNHLLGVVERTTALSKRFTGRLIRGRVYRSRWTLFGWPLIDINVSDAVVPDFANVNRSPERKYRTARGWIAIGDHAWGILFASADGFARGLIAFGGRPIGVISIGGIAVGLVAFGGVSLGGLAIGGVAVGGLAVGGAAVGWLANGGFALAVDVACGGAAFAWNAAFGGMAVASNFAVGGGAYAKHTNDDQAKAVLLNHPLKLLHDWTSANDLSFEIIIAVVVIALLALILNLLKYDFRSRSTANNEKTI